jgi:hypothetical protein
MARAVADIEQEIRALSASDKEDLLCILLEEMDGPADPDVDAAWLTEVQRRSQEIEAGRVRSVPATEVFAKIDREFRKGQ